MVNYKIIINGFSQSPEKEWPTQIEQNYQIEEQNDEKVLKFLISNVISCYLTSKNKLTLENIAKFNKIFAS